MASNPSGPDPEHERLMMHGQPSHAAVLDWAWVERELIHAGTYWIVAHGGPHPHPRPIWGVWRSRMLHLSVGSPVVARQLRRAPEVTVHLESSVDVVILEGRVHGDVEAQEAHGTYDDKYGWNYTVEEYGPLTTITPTTVLAWRSAGWAGRDGFQQAGRWRLEAPPSAAT